ncbi:MAG: STAS domain-containing protein [Bacteroidales bacterium]|nr:STAS domain-containing protein [Bacteroidales bacterium]
MFSVEYLNKAVIITAYNIRRINFRYQANLKKLILHALKRPCGKVILNLMGVRQIDPCAFEMIKQMHRMAENAGVKLCLLNLDSEITSLIRTDVKEICSCISEPAELEEYIESIAY